MQTLEALSNHSRSNTTITRKTVANGSEITLNFVAEVATPGTPASNTLGNPSLLAVGRSNPNSGPFSAVDYAQSPLGLEVVDILVGDGHLAERVYDQETVFVQHELGPNPHKHGAGCNCSADGQLNPDHRVLRWVENYLSHEKKIQTDGKYRPGEVALGSKDVFVSHASIIAGIAAVQ